MQTHTHIHTHAHTHAHSHTYTRTPPPPPPPYTHTHTNRPWAPPTPTSSLSCSPVPPPKLLPYNMKPAQLRWQKDVTYDSRGNIVNMTRLDPSKFPRHRYIYIYIITSVTPPLGVHCFKYQVRLLFFLELCETVTRKIYIANNYFLFILETPERINKNHIN